MSCHRFTHNDDTFAFHPLTLQSAKLSDTGAIRGWPERTTMDVKGMTPAVSSPSTLVLMLTYSCNMACRYCCQGEIPDSAVNTMPEEVARTAIDWLFSVSGDSPVLSLGFMGGEPFMKFPLMQSLTFYAEEKALRAGKTLAIGGMTNGLLLTDEIIDFITSHRMQLTVSFDGPRAVQNANRVLKDGSPSYDTIAPNLMRLTARFPSLTVRPTVFADEDLDEVIAECRRLGFRTCRLEKVSSSLLPEGMKNDETSATDAFISHFTRQADRLITAAEIRDRAAVDHIGFDAVFKEAVMLAVNANDDWSFPRRRWFACGAGRSFLTVDVRGNIYACPRFLALPDYRMGSVMDGTFDHGLHKKSLIIDGQECRECWARFICAGGCVVEHLAGTGSMFWTNHNTCRLRMGKFEQAIRVACTLDSESLRFMKTCFYP